MRKIAASYFLVIFLFSPAVCSAAKPNVLLISIDDLNDWVGCLDGHPQAFTPNIDPLAKRGVLFSNAHCQAPVCQPSRASLMVLRLPSSTGLYFLNPGLQQSEVAKDEKTLPEVFAPFGYKVMGAGKLFHHRDNQRVFDGVGEYGGNFGGFGPWPKKKISQPHGHPLWDWGAYPDDSCRPDSLSTSRRFDRHFSHTVGSHGATSNPKARGTIHKTAPRRSDARMEPPDTHHLRPWKSFGPFDPLALHPLFGRIRRALRPRKRSA